jgi:hypothetical protein
MSVIVYLPSGTRAPASFVPVHRNDALAPVPVAERTTVSAALVTCAAQRVAPVAASAKVAESRVPSPLGEISEDDAVADVSTGSVVSTVIP